MQNAKWIIIAGALMGACSDGESIVSPPPGPDTSVTPVDGGTPTQDADQPDSSTTMVDAAVHEDVQPAVDATVSCRNVVIADQRIDMMHGLHVDRAPMTYTVMADGSLLIGLAPYGFAGFNAHCSVPMNICTTSVTVDRVNPSTGVSEPVTATFTIHRTMSADGCNACGDTSVTMMDGTVLNTGTSCAY